MYKPYCYLIGWSSLNTWYYGSEYGSRCKTANPKNLWTTYFTSSIHVKDFRSKHGEPDVIVVRKEFTSAKDAITWEYKVLKRLKVKPNPKWLNKNDGKAPIGIPWSESKKIKVSLRMSGNGNHRYGKYLTEATKLKISRTLTGKQSKGMLNKTHTVESKQRMKENHKDVSGTNNPNYNKSHSEESRNQMSASRNPKVWKFVHQSYGTINSTVRLMTIKFPDLKCSGVKALCSGKLLTYKGWKLHTP
jgi:hypothetical protein